MPRKTKDAPGRVTPKGGPARRGGSGGGGRAVDEPAGATPPRSRPRCGAAPAGTRCSSWCFFAIGLVGIMLNYLGILPGGASNMYLFIGLGFIVAGFIAATRWH